MAMEGIGIGLGTGGGGGSALERFQALRESARKQIEVGDGQANLAELIKRKQAQMGAEKGASAAVPGNAAKALAGRILSGFAPLNGGVAKAPTSGIASGAAANANGAAAATSGTAAYGRSGGLQKQNSRPTLGRHVDFMA
ncbi:MAG: hypothetical protein ABIW76_15080 [Fibrobacteria bacterium]